MNVIVSNKQKEIIDNANIDAIKDLNGLFNVDDLINKFKNYFFSKMILDATSVIDFATKDVLKKLADEIGPDRLIVLLPSTPEPPDEFKKMLVDLKIYNFSNKIEDVVRYIENPNTYENVMNSVMNTYNNSDGFYVDNSIKENESDENGDAFEPNIDSDENKINNYNDIKGGNHSSLGDAMSRMSFHNNQYDEYDSSNDNEYESTESNSNIALPKNDDNHDKLDNYSSALNSESSNENANRTNVFLDMGDFSQKIKDTGLSTKKIIGFKNVTLHAGSTTLIYMLHKFALKNNYNVLSIEINKNDFRLFRDNKMISVSDKDILNTINAIREEIVFVDLNDASSDNFCDEIIYLVEPSTIKLNMLMATNKSIFNELSREKVVLNKCLLQNSDIPVLENEAGMKFFFKVSPVNDRIDNEIISDLFNILVANK